MRRSNRRHREGDQGVNGGCIWVPGPNGECLGAAGRLQAVRSCVGTMDGTEQQRAS